MVDVSLAMTYDLLPDTPDVAMTEHSVTAEDGHEIPVRWYTRTGASSSLIFPMLEDRNTKPDPLLAPSAT